LFSISVVDPKEHWPTQLLWLSCRDCIYRFRPDRRWWSASGEPRRCPDALSWAM